MLVFVNVDGGSKSCGFERLVAFETVAEQPVDAVLQNRVLADWLKTGKNGHGEFSLRIMLRERWAERSGIL